MTNLALYRKYRPKGFEALIGQEPIKNTLFNALTHNKVSHAYLFSGPRGTGKTSAAKILARALNCSQPTGVEPCGECSGCKDSNPDILEIDAASNNGVDDIRELREKVSYSPVYGKYKVYIIDEVHMLTTQAFNALLKTLEEPPAHAVFILATTEPHKIPLTILSRCQRYDFRRISQEAIVERMQFIIQQESVKVADEALQLIAQISAGGMRDALSLLDQAISHASGEVGLQDVINLTGAVDTRKIGKLIQLISQKEIEPALEHFNKCFQSGQEPKFFLEEMMIYYRDILMHQKLGTRASLKKGLTDTSFEQIAASVNAQDIYPYLSLLQETMGKLKFHNDAQLLVEMTIVEMINGAASLVTEVETLKKQVAMLLNGSVQTAPAPVITKEPIVSQPEPEPILVDEVKTPIETPKSENELTLISADDFFGSQIPEVESVPTVEAKEEKLSKTIEAPVGKEMELISFEDLQKGFSQTFSEPKPDESVEKQPETPVLSVVSDSEDIPFLSSSDEPEEELKDTSIGHFNKQAAGSNPFMSTDKAEAAESNSFLELVAKAETDGADWIEVIDEPAEAEAEFTDFQPFESLPAKKEKLAVIQPDIDESIFTLLAACSKVQKAEFLKQYEEILSTLKETKLSTFSLFREFSVHAVSEMHLVLSHAEPLKVKMLEKVTNRSIVEGVLEDGFKPLKLKVLSADEWKQISDQIRMRQAQ